MILLRFVYFLLIGWWFGGLVAIAGYLLCASVIGLPFGVLFLNRLPTALFLHETAEICDVCPAGTHPEPFPFILRVIWFFILGWDAVFFRALA